MNSRNLSFRHQLQCCPKCGMYSGKRVVLETNPEKFFVLCEACGFRTKGYPTQASATREWTNACKKKGGY